MSIRLFLLSLILLFGAVSQAQEIAKGRLTAINDISVISVPGGCSIDQSALFGLTTYKKKVDCFGILLHEPKILTRTGAERQLDDVFLIPASLGYDEADRLAEVLAQAFKTNTAKNVTIQISSLRYLPNSFKRLEITRNVSDTQPTLLGGITISTTVISEEGWARSEQTETTSIGLN